MGYLKKYVKKFYKLFIVAVAFLSVEASCDLFLPTLMSRIVDVGIKNRDLSFILATGGLMLLITGIGAAAAVTRNNISSRVSQRFGTELRFDLFSKIEHLSYGAAAKFETASLVTRLTNDVTQTQNFVNGMMRIFVRAPLLCIGSIIMAVALDKKFSLIIAAVVPVIILIIYLNTKIGYPFYRKMQKAIDSLNGVMREYLSGVRVVKAFDRFDYERERFSQHNDSLMSVSTTAMRVTAIFSPLIITVVHMGVILVLWFGGIEVNKGGIEVGKVMAFINYMTMISQSLMMISMVFNMFIRAKASAERIGEVMNAEDPMVSGTVSASAKAEGVKFENVSFSYSGDLSEPVLKDISFECRAGETLGIIGTTGAGKTSLINLIPRFYDAAQGRVSVNGIDVREWDVNALRDKIAMVPQKNTLFSGTVMQNILFGRKDASQDEVIAAAKTARAHDFIMKTPQGYDTYLGQGGVNLSGGQKQRIAIARALVKKAGILILDDSLSAVDVITEMHIREGLKDFSKELVCITIAQRITSIMSADKILVLENGEMAGLGTHEQLLAGCGIYREIYASQFGKEAV